MSTLLVVGEPRSQDLSTGAARVIVQESTPQTTFQEGSQEMAMSARAHKTVADLLKRLESPSGGRKGGGKRPVTLARRREASARRHRLAITLLAIVRGGIRGGGGGGGSGPTPKTAEGIEDLMDILEEQQERATEEPEYEEPDEEPDDEESPGGPGPNIGSCWSLYMRYQAAVAARNYLQASRLLAAYHTCLRASASRPSPLPIR